MENFNVVIPAELQKSDDGEWRVRGLASTDSCDLQGETVIQKGMDLTPIDSKKGIINFDHGKGPENIIGVLDGYGHTERGLFLEGRLLKKHQKAIAVKEIMDSLGEGDRGRMGMSVEGKIIRRNKDNPAVIEKCLITGVALTMNPVNSDTYVDLVKSLNAESVEIDAHETHGDYFTEEQVLEIVKKALGMSGEVSAPGEKTGGDALAKEDLDKSDDEVKQVALPDSDLENEEDEEEHKAPVTIKDMEKSQFVEGIESILKSLQVEYPEMSRRVLWEALKTRLGSLN